MGSSPSCFVSREICYWRSGFLADSSHAGVSASPQLPSIDELCINSRCAAWKAKRSCSPAGSQPHNRVSHTKANQNKVLFQEEKGSIAAIASGGETELAHPCPPFLFLVRTLQRAVLAFVPGIYFESRQLKHPSGKEKVTPAPNDGGASQDRLNGQEMRG